MKWIKHYANAHTSQFITALLDQKKGHYLHSCYWLIIELLCAEFKKDTTVFHISSSQLLGVLRIKYESKLQRLIEDLTEIAQRFDRDLLKIEPISTGSLSKIYKIETRIILELMGKDFKRTRHRSGNATAKNKEERIKNKKKEIKKEKSRPEAGVFDFEALYKLYPRKVGKKKGIETLTRKIKTQSDYDNLRTAILNYRDMCEHEKLENRFIKHFSSFVGVWQDYLVTELQTARESARELFKNPIATDEDVKWISAAKNSQR